MRPRDENDLRSPAQTTVQLYDQLQRYDFDDSALREVRRAAGFAVRLYAGRISNSPRLHLCHCVGAASLLAAAGADLALIVAGLTHSAYRQGDFGPWRATLPQRRRRLRQALGRDVEALVYQFHCAQFSPAAIAAHARQTNPLAEDARRSLTLCTVNQLEPLAAGALLYQRDGERLRREALANRQDYLRICERIGSPAIARAFTAALDDLAQSEIADELRGEPARTVVPLSAHRRREARAVQWLHGLARGALRPAATKRSEPSSSHTGLPTGPG